jgi:predicted nucleic acid-binding protein
MIVVDNNILVYFILRGPFEKKADQVFICDNDWIMPRLWRSEFGNVISIYHKQNLITRENAKSVWNRAIEILETKEFSVDGSRTLLLALESGCTYYDCEYVQLALQFDVPLITEDKKILKAFPDVAVSMDNFINGKS